MDTQDTPELMAQKLKTLRLQHSGLDAEIARLVSAPTKDELTIRRLKKQKLQLKDTIFALERLLEPDELA